MLKLELKTKLNIPKHFEEALDRSIAQMESGNFLSNEEVMKSFEDWLYR